MLSVVWSPVGRQILSGSDDCTLRLWDVDTGKCLRVFEEHEKSVLSVAWSPNGGYLMSSSWDKTVRLWAADTGNCRRVLEAKPGITGLWQVGGRSRTTFDDMVRLDLRYARTCSFWADIKILLATPGAVFSGKGAC